MKNDGFRALAHVEGHQCRLVSRRGHTCKSWPNLCAEIAHSVRATSAILDGEIVCLDADGRSVFYRLMFRRDWPYFYAFNVLAVDGEDLRAWPLCERKRRLRSIMPAPRVQSRLLYVDHVRERGSALFRAASDRDLEGIVAKWSDGPYETDGRATCWIKVRNLRLADDRSARIVRALARASRPRLAHTPIEHRESFGLTHR